MAVCGPSGCGKTEIIFQMRLKNTFFPNFKSIYYFYQQDQPKFQTIERNLNIYFTKFSGFEFISQLENCLLVFWRFLRGNFQWQRVFKTYNSWRPQKISVIYVKHNLFQQSKWSRTNDLNTTHIILFKSPRDIQQISYIGKQLYWTQKQPTHYVIVQILYHRGQQFSICHLPKLQLPTSEVRVKETCMLRRMLEMPESKLKKFIKKSSNKFIKFLCECFLNVINGNVPPDKSLLENYETSIRHFLSKETSLRKKRQLLVKNLHLLRSISLSCYLYLKKK